MHGCDDADNRSDEGHHPGGQNYNNELQGCGEGDRLLEKSNNYTQTARNWKLHNQKRGIRFLSFFFFLVCNFRKKKSSSLYSTPQEHAMRISEFRNITE